MLINERDQQVFQFGCTLSGSGVWGKSQVITATSNCVGSEAGCCPEGNKVVTSTGKTVPYDYLAARNGLKLDYAAINGMNLSLVGTDGSTSVYASSESASASWQAMQKFVKTGGVGAFIALFALGACAAAASVWRVMSAVFTRQRLLMP